jgi:hypothetical protein
MEPAARLAEYLQTELPRTLCFDDEMERYAYMRYGTRHFAGGLHRRLRARYYPHYRDNRSRRKWRTTQIRGSTAAQGKRVDREICEAVGAAPGRGLHAYTQRILRHWREAGHTLRAAQVASDVRTLQCMTQADAITTGPDGRLWLWEIKTGVPVGFLRQQGMMRAPLQDVKCTKANQWQLQLHYTRRGLEAAGVPIAEARILHVYEKKRARKEVELVCAERPQEPWLRALQ